MVHFRMNDFNFNNKRVLVRLGTDVPVSPEGNILDEKRIAESLSTLRYILEKNPSKLILICHMGRPKNNETIFKTDKVAERLSSLLGQNVKKVDDWGENGLPADKIIFLENLRFNPNEKNKDSVKRDMFGKHLASLADVFVQDAFSNCHHDDASMIFVTKYVPSCAGLLVEKEVSNINGAMQNPQRPFVSIIGGLKAEKLNAVQNIAKRADKVLIAGALAFTVLKNEGYNVGMSKIDSEGLNSMKEILEEVKKTGKMILPVDAVVANKFDANADSKIVKIDQIPDSWLALDIGPESVRMYLEHIKDAKTIVWNGPIGVFEFDKFSHGTRAIAKALVEKKNNAVVIIGGGDSAEVIDKLGYEKDVTLVSSGGGASLEMFEGKKLIAITALEENYGLFKDRI